MGNDYKTGFESEKEKLDTLLEIIIKGTQKQTLDYIAKYEGWEETRDCYAIDFGLPQRYKKGVKKV